MARQYDKAFHAFWGTFYPDEFLRDMSTVQMVGISTGASLAIVGTGGLVATVGVGAGAAAGTAAATGARLVPALAPSDRNIKDNFAPVNVREVLHRVAGLPISTWNYQAEDPRVRHIGPTAQDFHAVFGFGQDDKHIVLLDADGVALAAIQGLHELLREKDAEMARLRTRLDALETKIAALGAEGD